MGSLCDEASELCVSDLCAQGDLGTLEGCPCDEEGACASPLECLDQEGMSLCVNRVGQEGGLCDTGARCDDFETAGGRSLTCQSGVCVCRAGDLGCDCDESGACGDQLSCQLTVGRRGVCADCAGELGCLCGIGNQCDEGLSCQSRLCRPAACEAGAESCDCDSEGACQNPNTCIPLNGVQLCVECAGQEGCVCGIGNQCEGDLRCDSGLCTPPCPPGETGCPCDAEGVCSSSADICHSDSDVEPTCQADLIGTAGFPCDTGARCDEGLECRSSGLCDVPCQIGELGCPCEGESSAECGVAARCLSVDAMSLCAACDGELGCGCDSSADCAVGQCVAGVCSPACPTGTASCACRIGGACDEGLSCEAGLCIDPLCPERGVEGCPCDGGRCEAGLTCARGTDGPRCVPCSAAAPFELGCGCGINGQCESGRCFEGRCEPPCAPGLIGCECDQGECLFPLSCDQTTNVCVDRRGQLGAPCDQGACIDEIGVCMPNGFCCAEGSENCACTEDHCGGALECRRATNDPATGLCVSCQGELGCPCQVGADCGAGLSCEGGRCSPSCIGREGEDGCPCLETSACADPAQCQLGERCAPTSRCTPMNQGEERCEYCVGDLGCFCLPRQLCNGDYVCNSQGVCEELAPCEELGEEGCLCNADHSCNGQLNCRLENGYERCVNCIGQEGCLCAPGALCDSVTCNDQGLCECVAGTEGCPCAEGDHCGEGLNCVDRGEGPRCLSCVGQLDCYCAPGASCIDQSLICSGSLCLDRCELERGVGCDCTSDLTCPSPLNCRSQSVGGLACENCVGQEGCLCRPGAMCDEGLSCNPEGRCTRPCLIPGSAGCECASEDDCQSPTNCRQEGDFSACRECAGQLGCFCAPGATCQDENLECYQGHCVERCEPGSEGCRCLNGELCALDNRCVNDLCTSCLGELGCGCDVGSSCSGDAVCAEGICVPNSCGSAYACINAGLEGFLCIDEVCRVCETDRECERSSAYGLGSVCTLGRCVDPPSECDPTTEFCECATALDCNQESTTEGMVCIDFQCVACRNNSNCSSAPYYGLGAQCVNDRCVAWESPCDDSNAAECACQGWSDCHSRSLTQNMLCVENECRPCLSDSMCEQLSQYGAGSICEDGRCLPPLRCDPNLETCTCVTALDCDLNPVTAGRLCVEGDCIACTDDFQCVRAAAYGPGSTCDVNSGRCRASACAAGETCCRTSADCDNLVGHEGELCIDGVCQDCASDALCQRSPYYGAASNCIAGACQ